MDPFAPAQVNSVWIPLSHGREIGLIYEPPVGPFYEFDLVDVFNFGVICLIGRTAHDKSPVVGGNGNIYPR